MLDPLRDPLKGNAVVPQKYVEALEQQGWIRPIRCKDCKHYFPDYEHTIDGNVVVYRCELNHEYGRDDFFCADGETRRRAHLRPGLLRDWRRGQMKNDDLIWRGDLIAAYDAAHKGPPGGARKLMEEAPAVDAAPVKHGRWEEKMEHLGLACCSVCHDCYVEKAWIYNKKWGWCPQCGARMDGGKSDE